MPTIIQNSNEIELNSLRYKLGGDGQIHPRLSSILAPKQVIGDYSKDSDPNRSVWSVISDQSGGIGIEDMDETKHARRSWWSGLNQEYPGYTFLNDLSSTATLTTLPTVTDGGMETWSDSTTLTNWTKTLGVNCSLTQGTGTDKYAGTYAAHLGASRDGAVSTTASIVQTLGSWSNDFRGKVYSITFYYKTVVGSGASPIFSAIINDGVGSTVTNLTEITWGQATATRILSDGATKIDVSFQVDSGTVGGSDSSLYVDVVAVATITTVSFMCDYNGDTYFSAGQILYRIDNSTGTIYLEGVFPATITGLVASIGSCFYVAVGTSNYYYRTTAGVWAQTDVAADKIIQWDNKFFRYVASTGQLSYTATPNTASPSFTNKGLVDTGSQGTVNNLITYQDATGADTLYAATTKGLIAHDYTNALWLNTDLKVPTHPDNGKGVTVQNGNLYYSAGLAVWEYNAVNGTIRNVGVDTSDGLPDEYVGSISGLIGGFGGEFYALVDASLVSASNYSSIQKYRNGAWFPVWVDSSANVSLGCGILTSTYAYRLWFGYGSELHYQAQNRARRNPIKQTWNYAASGIYLSPWFDAAWTMGNKLALATRALANATTSTETITIKYRTNKTNTNLGTGWTTHDTLVAADAGVESAVALGSNSGIVFNTIQFRVDFARGGTTTATPKLLYLILEYERVIPAKWSWSFTVDCHEEYNGKSGNQLLELLLTAVESQTLVTFYFKDVAKYVRIVSAEGSKFTGNKTIGQYDIVVMEK